MRAHSIVVLSVVALGLVAASATAAPFEEDPVMPHFKGIKKALAQLDAVRGGQTPLDGGVEGGVSTNDPFDFLPEYEGAMMLDGDSLTYSTRCWSEVTAKVETKSDRKAKVTITTGGKHTSSLCTDFALIGTYMQTTVKSYLTKGSHSFIIRWDDGELDEVMQRGVHVFVFPEKVTTLASMFYETMRLFYQVDPNRNREFLEKKLEYKYPTRDTGLIIPPPETWHSGDQIHLNKFNSGKCTLIDYATGSRTCHLAMFLWFPDGKLYAVESGGTPGVIKTEYHDYLKREYEAEHQLVVLKLKPELREKFDADAAIKFFETIEGNPYGHPTLFTSWLDTTADNLPAPLSGELPTVLFTMFEKLSPSWFHKLFQQPLNRRLGTEGLGAMDILKEATKKGMSLMELAIIPEEDHWTYDLDGSGPKTSVVCSQIVQRLYMTGGLFEGLDIKGNEFTPHDNYLLNMFDTDSPLPAECVDDLPYCQLMGDYLLELPGFNTKEPYDHMNENCPGLPPNYERPDDC